jgi:hypothetical protein
VVKGSHTLPEHFIGSDISQEQAQQIVYDFIKKEYGLGVEDTTLISVNSDKFDNRRDWTIIIQDKQVFEGQARIKVKVSGNKVTEFSRFIFVPESWTRTDQEKIMNLKLIKSGLWFLMFVLMAFSSMLGINMLKASRLGLQMIRHKGIFVATVFLIHSVNSFVILIGSFNTSEPFYDQLIRISLSLVTKTLYQVLFYSVFLAIGAVGFIRCRRSNFIQSLLLSCAAASTFLAVNSLFSLHQPFLEPVVGAYDPIGHWFSSLAFCAGYIKIFYLFLSLMIGMFVLLKLLRNFWPNQIWMQIFCSILFSIPIQSFQGASLSISWLILHGFVMGIVLFLIYHFLLQYDMTLLPLVFGFYMIGIIIPEFLYPSYVGASFDALITIGVIAIISLLFYQRAHQE